MAELRTDYVDDVLDTSKNTIRKYKQIQNGDGTVSFVDVTEYLTVGTEFGAKDINDITKANNDLNESLAILGGFAPIIDKATGQITGYKTTIGGADTVFPFKTAQKVSALLSNTGTGGSVTAPDDGIAVCVGWGYDTWGSDRINISSSCSTIVYDIANGSRLYVGCSSVKKGDNIRITLSHNGGSNPKDRTLILFIS